MEIFKNSMRTAVDSEDGGGGRESSQILSQHVEENFDEGQASNAGHGQWDSGVQVGARDTTCHKNSHHNANSPSPVNGKEVSIGSFAQFGLCNASITENLIKIWNQDWH